MNKKSLTPVLSITMLLAAAVFVAIAFLGWYSNFSYGFFSSVTDGVTTNRLDILSINSSTLVVRSFSTNDFSFEQVAINNSDCEISGTINSRSINFLDISSCTSELDEGFVVVRIISSNGVFFKDIYYR